MEPGYVSNRPHAHSKRKRSAPPRSFSSSTGLTGVTQAELDHRVEITAVAMAAAENAARKAPRSPRFTPPKASRAPVTRPPRSFSLPPEPDPSPGTDVAARTEAARAQLPGAPWWSEGMEANAPLRSPPGPKDEASPRDEAPRPPRALVAKVTGAVVASGATASKVVKARAARSGDASGPSGGAPTDPPTPAPAESPSAGSAPTEATSRRLTFPRVGRKKVSPDEKAVGKKATGSKATGKKATGKKATGEKTVRTEGSRRVFSGVTQAKAAPTQKKPTKQKTPASPEQRRHRIPVAVAGVFALAVLATSFPLSQLLSQHHQLSASGAQLAQVQRENKSLTRQEHALGSNVAISQLARGEYQMVSPGQTLFDVLPPSRKRSTGTTGATGTTTPGSAVNGDPGNQPLVAPANAPDLSSQAALAQPTPVSVAETSKAAATAKDATSSSSSRASTVPSAPTTFWGRVSQTLQFWR